MWLEESYRFSVLAMEIKTWDMAVKGQVNSEWLY